MASACPFCSPDEDEIVLRNDRCYARWDRYPISNGHLLIIPFRHEPSFLLLTAEEQAAVLDLISQATSKLDSEFRPDGYNVGMNVTRWRQVPHSRKSHLLVSRNRHQTSPM